MFTRTQHTIRANVLCTSHQEQVWSACDIQHGGGDGINDVAGSRLQVPVGVACAALEPELARAEADGRGAHDRVGGEVAAHNHAEHPLVVLPRQTHALDGHRGHDRKERLDLEVGLQQLRHDHLHQPKRRQVRQLWCYFSRM